MMMNMMDQNSGGGFGGFGAGGFGGGGFGGGGFGGGGFNPGMFGSGGMEGMTGMLSSIDINALMGLIGSTGGGRHHRRR
jgi:hypothetical protein